MCWKVNRNGQKKETEIIDSQIIKLMNQNPQITQVEICEITGFRKSTITNHIRKLKETHIIERIGSDRKGYWNILEPNK